MVIQFIATLDGHLRIAARAAGVELPGEAGA
jgi:hypothetical protein